MSIYLLLYYHVINSSKENVQMMLCLERKINFLQLDMN